MKSTDFFYQWKKCVYAKGVPLWPVIKAKLYHSIFSLRKHQFGSQPFIYLFFLTKSFIHKFVPCPQQL